MKRTPVFIGLFQALGLVIYVSFIVWVLTCISSAAKFDGKIPAYLGMAFMLILLIISVLICGAIGLGYPIWFLRQARTREAYKTVVWTIGWLATFIVIFFAYVCAVAYFSPQNKGATMQIANPASVNCVNKGGRVEIKDSSQGQYGVCIFPSGKSCEEWALYRGECSAK